MPTLGLAMIAKDEEKTLPRLFESIRGVFDEVVIIDTGSSDRTKEVAASYGARIYDFKWIDDFAAARTFAFSKVQSDWTCWLDCDDVLRPLDRERLIDLKNTLGNADAYLMMYDYAQNDKDEPICKFFRHRIVRTSLKIKWDCPIHEHLCIPPGTREAMTNIVVTHKRTAEAAAQDKGRNIRMLKKAVLDRPNDQRMKFYYGKELYNEGGYEESIKILEAYLKIGDWHDNMVNAWFWVAMSYWSLKKDEKAIDACMSGIRLDPRFAEFYYVIGQIYQDRSDYGNAIRWHEIAASCPVPEVWGTVLLEYYREVPRDRLCQCYANLGMHRKAYEWNEAALTFRQDLPHMQFNKRWLEDVLYDRLSTRPVRLNLGSGGKPETGYRGCDLFPGDGIEFQMDQAKLPYRDGTVHAIRSEHALEHSDSHYSAEATLKEWARALRYGGFLDLKLPDLDECCRLFHLQEDRPRKDGERWTPKEWYKLTIYGTEQATDTGGPAEGQYHRTGFTKAQLRRLLEWNGFEVTKLDLYDGWGTPSIHAQAVQTKKKVKVAWMLRGTDENDPSTRIRRLNISKQLSKSGDIETKVFEAYHGRDEGAIHQLVQDYDVVIFSFFSDLERKAMDKLRLSGITAIADYNEDLNTHGEVARCLESATLIVCCSPELAKKASKFGRTVVIPDAYEMMVNGK